MTAADPRVGEIEARLAAATKLGEWETRDNAVVIYDPNGYGAYCLISTTDTKGDAEFIANAPADVAYLLTQLRARDAKLARVEALVKYLDTLAPGDKHYASLIRAAVAAATGDGE